MLLTVNDIKDNSIYLEAKGSLGARIDFAWSVYINKAQRSEATRNLALKFLIYAFDIKEPQNVNTQLMRLIAERVRYQYTNPDYIPGKSPDHLPFDPRRVKLQRTKKHGKGLPEDITRAIRTQELLDVADTGKAEDEKLRTRFFTPEERAALRVHIHEGLFKKNGKIFNTSDMTSHEKTGFASFTLNSNGELTLFNHHGMVDHIAHSSANAGAPVVAAGELQIKNGKLKTITTHSGHYKPSLFNVYRLLEHFHKHGVNIHQAEVITFNDPSKILKGVKAKAFKLPAYPDRTLYNIPASQLYHSIDKIIKDNIQSIDQQIQSYTAGGIFSTLYHIKDKITGSKLTQKRAKMANALQIEVTALQKTLHEKMSPEEWDLKIYTLEQIISRYKQKNENLSLQWHKEKNNGRLASKLSFFKEQLSELKSTKEKETNNLSSMKGIK